MKGRSRANRHMRADAQRNIESLLQAAMAVFATSGVDAPVREIAEKALAHAEREGDPGAIALALLALPQSALESTGDPVPLLERGLERLGDRGSELRAGLLENKVTLKSVLAVNDGSVYISASALGHGIIQPSRFMVADLIAQGALKEILTTYTSPGTPLSILYAHRRNLSSRLRAFTEWVTQLARNNPDLRITNL